MTSERMELRLSPDLLERIDDWRSAQDDIPNRSEAVRRLVVGGMSGGQSRQLFEQTRTQIKLAAVLPFDRRLFSDPYVFAWDHGLYPIFHEDRIARSFADFFDVEKEKVLELAEFLDDRWLSKDELTFYQLEDHYGVRYSGSRWDRIQLLDCCHYFHLDRKFDDPFWECLLKPMEHPAEAKSVVRPWMAEKEIYFR